MACRQTFNIWYMMKFKWGWRNFFRCSWWEMALGLGPYKSYLWEDSFGCYLYRWVLCPLFGHDPRHLSDSCDGKGPHIYCFKCQSRLPY